MKTKQPIWKLSANLGDVNPLDDGALLFTDETGVYPPELVLIEANLPKEGEDETFTVSRVQCERCFLLGEGVSDNRFHKDRPAWFSDKLASVASYCGSSPRDLQTALCDQNEVNRGLGYQSLVGYFGVFEFDQYPSKMTEAELRNRYPEAFKR